MKRTNFIDTFSAQEQLEAARLWYGYGALLSLLIMVIAFVQTKQIIQWHRVKKEYQLMRQQAEHVVQGLSKERELQQQYQEVHNKIVHIGILKKMTYDLSSVLAVIAQAVAVEKIKRIVLSCAGCELIVQVPDINYALHVVQKLSSEPALKQMQIHSIQQDSGRSLVVVLSSEQL